MDFETLYRRYARDVCRFALYLSGSEHLADDIAAETFVRAWTSPAPIREGTVKAYLFAIARNLYRATLREGARLDELDLTRPDIAPGPEATAATRIELERVRRQLQKLPEIDRAVLLMRAEEDLTYEQIAAVVGITPGAAKVKVHRARARLAAAAKEE
jgi:RNA polymerase sigma-70 factor (ECF subfamily)